VTFVLNQRLDLPTYFGISRFPKKAPVWLQKKIVLLYPMCSIPGEDDGLGKCKVPA